MSAEENNRMVDYLVEGGYLHTPSVIKAFKKVDRKNFVPENYKNSAYDDTPLHIGFNQTISAPSMVAIMTEKLDVKEGQKILEIGAGSGYQAALLSELVGNKGKVFTVERIKEVSEMAKKNLKDYKNVKVILGDGTLGYKKEAPYEGIIVTAAAPKVPEPLIEQLKINGILAIPVGNFLYGQDFVLIRKKKVEGKEKIEQEFVCGCVFVPLIGEYGVKEES